MPLGSATRHQLDLSWNLWSVPASRCLGAHGAAVEWAERSAAHLSLKRTEAEALRMIASYTDPLWGNFRLCISALRRLLGLSRSPVERALRRLRELGLIARSGSVKAKIRDVVVYRLESTPDCPLPEGVMRSRDPEAWTLETPPTSEETYTKLPTGGTTTGEGIFEGGVALRPGGLDLAFDRKEREKPQNSHTQINNYRSAKPIKTRPKAKTGDTGLSRREPYFQPARKSPRRWLAESVAREVVRRFQVSPRAGNAVTYIAQPTHPGGHVSSVFTDPQFGTLSRDARLLYLGLVDIADEDDTVLSDPRHLKAEIFRYDDDLTPDAVAELVSVLVAAGKIHTAPGLLIIADPPVRSVPEPGALFALPGKAVAVRRGDPEEAFKRFWAAYPRRQGRGAAKKAFLVQVAAGRDPEMIIAVAAGYAQRCRDLGKEPQFTPYASTWLNQDRFEDDPEEAPTVRSRTDDVLRQNLDMVQKYADLDGVDPRDLGRITDPQPPQDIW